MKELTPAMRQYFDIKEKHSEAILFFRMGDFYEMFFDDAKIASRLLGITLTSRERDKKNGIPMCGVPHHSAGSYIARLVKKGQCVAICEQVEEAKKGKGIVKREVTQVITPGIAIFEEILDSKKNNYIAAVSSRKKEAGLAYMDVTTGEFKLTNLDGIDTLKREIARIEPSEIIVPADICEILLEGNKTRRVTRLSNDYFDFEASSRLLSEHMNVSSLSGYGLKETKEGIIAAAALLEYVGKTQKNALGHIKNALSYSTLDYMMMDSTTKKNLEIFSAIADGGKKGSLLWVLDKTKTAMAARKLKSWLNYPLMDTTEIRRRQDAVSELLDERPVISSIQDCLGAVHDMERLVGRVSIGIASPRDIVALKESLICVPKIKKLIEGNCSSMLKDIVSGLDDLKEVTELIDNAINSPPPSNPKAGGIIRNGWSKDLDEIRNISRSGKKWLLRYEAEQRSRLRIPALRVSYNRVFGYYIEISRSKVSEIPSDYIRKQTLTNSERYITDELKEWEDRILGSEERAANLETVLFNKVRDRVAGQVSKIQETADNMATLDVLVSLASAAMEHDYVRPLVNDDDLVRVEEGRHPAIESILENRFVPNDLELDCSDNRLVIMTGPNMAGKSTYMRQAALIVIMAQIGSFVPAVSATVGVADKIFTRIGASDNLTRGESTFMVEMGETADILNNATNKSLIILDEIGRGTSTFDGISIAWAVAEYIHDNPGLKSRTLFATHYHELTDLSVTKEGVKNYHMTIREWNEKIIFLRKVSPGGSSRSYGIHVARLAGLPAEVVDRAKEVLNNLEKGEFDKSGIPTAALSKGRTIAPAPQLNMFVQRNKIVERLNKIDTDRLTPIDALHSLIALKNMIEEENE